MSKRYDEILVELVNKSSKKSRINGKQLLTLTRDFCYHAPLAPDEQWVSPILQIAKGATDNDTDQKIYRTCLFLVVSCLLSNKWVKNDKRRSSLLLEAVDFVRAGLSESAGSKLSLLWHTFGSLASLTSDTECITFITEAVLQSNKPKTAKNNIQTEPDKQLWNAKIFALRRFCAGTRGQKKVPIAVQLIDPIFIAAASSVPSISQHGSALLLLAASVLSSKSADHGSEIANFAAKILTSSQSSQRALNLSDPASASHILQTIAVLSTRNGIPETLMTELNLYGFKLLHHPSSKVFSDVVKYLLYGDRAKRTISQMQLKDKELKKTSVLSMMASECLKRLQQASPTDKRSTTAAMVSSLALPGILRAAAWIGMFSCDVSVRYSDVKVISKLWQGVLALHDSLMRANALSPHILLESLKALTWLTQSAIDKKDDEGHQWRDLKSRIKHCMPLLRLGNDPVLAIAYAKCVLERASQPESSVVIKQLDGDTNITVRHHSEASLQLLIFTGECMVKYYRTVDTVLVLEKIWCYVAHFTQCHGREKVKQMNLSNSFNSVLEADNQIQNTSGLSLLKPKSASYLNDMKDLTFPSLTTPPSSTSISPRRSNEIVPEHSVHKILRNSHIKALDSGLCTFSSSERTCIGDSTDRDGDQDRGQGQGQAIDLLMNELALWHLAEHALLLPNATGEITALIHRLTQEINFGPESLQQIAATSLIKIAIRLHRLTAKLCATKVAAGAAVAVSDNSPRVHSMSVTPRGQGRDASPGAYNSVLNNHNNKNNHNEIEIWASKMENHILQDIAIIVGQAMGLKLHEPRPHPHLTHNHNHPVTVTVKVKESERHVLNHDVIGSLLKWIQEEEKENMGDKNNTKFSTKIKHAHVIHKGSRWIQNDKTATATKHIKSTVIQNLYSALLALQPTRMDDISPSVYISDIDNSGFDGHYGEVARKEDINVDNLTDLRMFERPREVVWVTIERTTTIKPLTTYASTSTDIKDKDTTDRSLGDKSFTSITSDGPVLTLSSIDVLGFDVTDSNGTTTGDSFTSSFIPTFGNGYPHDFTVVSKSEMSILSAEKSDGFTSQSIFDGYNFANSTKTDTDIITTDTTDLSFPSSWLEGDVPVKSDIPAKISLTLLDPRSTPPKRVVAVAVDDSAVNPKVAGSTWRRGSLTSAPSLPLLFTSTTPNGSNPSSPERPTISRFQLSSTESSPSKPKDAKLTKSTSKRVLNSFTSSFSNIFSSSSSRSTDSISTSTPSVPIQDTSFQHSLSTRTHIVPEKEAISSFQPSKSAPEMIKVIPKPARSVRSLSIADPTNPTPNTNTSMDYLFNESITQHAASLATPASPVKARSFTLAPPQMPKNTTRRIQKPLPVTSTRPSKARSTSDAPDFINLKSSSSQDAPSFTFPSLDLTLSSLSLTDATVPSATSPSTAAFVPTFSDPFSTSTAANPFSTSTGHPDPFYSTSISHPDLFSSTAISHPDLFSSTSTSHPDPFSSTLTSHPGLSSSTSTASFTTSVSERSTSPFTASTLSLQTATTSFETDRATATPPFAASTSTLTSTSTSTTTATPVTASASSSSSQSTYPYPYPYSYQAYPTAGDPRHYYPPGGNYAPQAQAQYAYPYPYQAGLYGNYLPNPGPYWPPQPAPGLPIVTNILTEGGSNGSQVAVVNPFDKFIKK